MANYRPQAIETFQFRKCSSKMVFQDPTAKQQLSSNTDTRNYILHQPTVGLRGPRLTWQLMRCINPSRLPHNRMASVMLAFLELKLSLEALSPVRPH